MSKVIAIGHLVTSKLIATGHLVTSKVIAMGHWVMFRVIATGHWVMSKVIAIGHWAVPKVIAIFTVIHLCQKHLESARSLRTFVGLSTCLAVKIAYLSTVSLTTYSLPGKCSTPELIVRPWASFRSNIYFFNCCCLNT